jgi:hypothetical protein
MKILILSMLILAMAYFSDAQNVSIPDTNFKNALILVGVDTNEDGEISYAEAEAIHNLNVGEKFISDMTGIEAFVNLDTLFCNGNQLSSLDVTNNSALTNLYCYENQLTSLDVSNITALTELHCGGNQLTSLNVSGCTALSILNCNSNQLTSLDVSGCTALEFLYCIFNQLTSLDVTGCTALEGLYCWANQLTSLDLTNNSALTFLHCYENQLTSLDVSNSTDLKQLWCGDNQLTSLDLTNNSALENLLLYEMPTLFKVCIWEMPFPPSGTSIDTTNSPNVYFTTDCATTSLKPDKVTNGINIYPNPAKEFVVFDVAIVGESATVQLYNVDGKKVLEQKLTDNKQVSTGDLPKGLYMYKLNNKGYSYTGKLIIE